MFLTLFGVPSVLTTFGVEAIRCLLGAAAGEHEIIYPATVSDLKTAWFQKTSKHILSFNELPHGELISFLSEAGAPFVVFLSSGFQIFEGLIRERGLETLDAIRTSSICMSVLEEVAASPNALVIRSDGAKRNRLAQLLSNVMAFNEIRLDPVEFEAVLNQIVPPGVDPRTVYFEELYDYALEKWGPPGGLKPFPSSTVPGLAELWEGYAPILASSRISCLKWPPDLFMLMDKPGTPLSGFAELVGPARTIIYGPYLGVPRGSWLASLDIEVRGNNSGNVLLAEVTSDKILSMGKCTLPRNGRFKLEIAFNVDEPRHGIEIRIGILEGAIEGGIRLDRVEVVRSIQ